MTMFGGPGGLSLSGGGTHEYVMWDAAYVLGSLSSVDRRAYEAHLSTCPSCREAVSELDGMPALLAQLDRDVVESIEEGGNAWAVTAPQADASALTMTPVKPIPLSATSPGGSTSTPMDQIASVQAISADAGRCAATAKPLIWPGGEPKLLTGRVTGRRAGK
jgi:anti-sigma factor RsiW